jgi:hypothetical protein
MLPFVSARSARLLLLLAGLGVNGTAGAGSAILLEEDSGHDRPPLDVRRYLLLESPSGPAAAAVTVVEPAQRLLSGAGSAVRREVLDILARHSATMGGAPALRQRRVQQDPPEELTFDDVCAFLTGIINEGAEGAIVCTCTSSTSTLYCGTPDGQPVCDNGSFGTGICASLAMSITFLDNFGVDEFTVGVNYTGVDDPSGPLRDGVVTADFAEDGTTLASCRATFDDASGVPTDCLSCYGCNDTGTSAAAGYLGFALDCSNIYPGATTSGCYGVGGTVEQATALFPGADNGGGSGGGGNGTATNSTGGGGTGGGDGSGSGGDGSGSGGDGSGSGGDGSGGDGSGSGGDGSGSGGDGSGSGGDGSGSGGDGSGSGSDGSGSGGDGSGSGGDGSGSGGDGSGSGGSNSTGGSGSGTGSSGGSGAGIGSGKTSAAAGGAGRSAAVVAATAAAAMGLALWM